MNRNQAVEKIFKAKRLLSYLALTVIREKKKKGYSKFNSLYIEFNLIVKYIVQELDFRLSEIAFQVLIESLTELNTSITCNEVCFNNTYTNLSNDKSSNLSQNSFFLLSDTFQSNIAYAGYLLKVSSDGKRIIPVEDKPELDLESKTLVTPTILANWTIFKNDGVTPYNPATSNLNNLTVEVGCVVNLTSTFSYPTPTSEEALPTAVTGSYGTAIPLPNVNSAILSATASNDTSYSVTLSKPKSGLIVVNNQVKFPTGFDTTSASINVLFRYKGYYLISNKTVLTASDILTATAPTYQNSRSRNINNITSGVGNNFFYIYPSSMGDLTSVILDGAAPILGAFTKLSTVSVLLASGITINYNVYKTNATNAFSNNNLSFA